MMQEKNRKNLDEVSFVRPILILMVVLYHSMAIHVGSWDLPDNMTIIPLYRETGKLAYSFMLEAFVFISGYVWAYQREKRGRIDGFLTLCKKKILRLIVPSVLFGLLYVSFFERDRFNAIHVLEGPGHLWFLPMLFWCFLIGWLILKLKVSPKIIVPILYLICLFRPANLPLRFSYTFYYLPFFFIGYYTLREYDFLKDKITKGCLFVVWTIFIVSYAGTQILTDSISIGYRGGQICQVIYATLGTLAILATGIHYTNKSKLNLIYIFLGNLCMGVYIFQQFILEAIYYHSPIPSILSNWFTPLIAFVVTLIFSVAFTYLFRLHKLGKALL